MEDNQTFQDDLRVRLQQATSVRELDEVMAEIESLPLGDRLSFDRLVVQTLFSLLSEPEPIASFMRRWIMPLALVETPSESRAEWHLFKQVLAGALDSTEGWVRLEIVKQLTPELRRGLRDNQDFATACAFVDAIGFRDPAIEKDLFDAIGRGDDRSIVALNTLASLGTDPSLDDVFSELLLTHLQHEDAWERLLYSVQERGAKAHALAVMQRMETCDDKQFYPLDIGLSAVASVASRHMEDNEFQDKIWEKILHLLELFPGLTRVLQGGSHIAPCINTRGIVPWLMTASQREPATAYSRYLFFLRALEATGPRQLAGWVDVPDGLALASPDLLRDTEARGRWTTTEMRQKETAARILACCAPESTSEVLISAAEIETNTFVRADLLELASLFPCKDLPPMVRQLVLVERQTVENTEEVSASELLEATKYAAAVSSVDSLRALTHFGLSSNESPLLTSIDAIYLLARKLSKEDPDAVARELLAMLDSSRPQRHKNAGVAVIAALLPIWTLSSFKKALLQVCRDSEFAEHSRLTAIRAITQSMEDEQQIRVLLVELIESETGKIKWQSAVSLATLGAVHLVVQELGGATTRDALTRARDEFDNESWGELVAAFDAHDHGVRPLTLKAIVEDDIDVVYALLDGLLERGARTWDSDRTRGLLLHIYRRIVQDFGPYRAKPFLITCAFQIDAESAIKLPWNEAWSDWHEEAVATLAREAGEVALTTGKARRQALSLLVPLMLHSSAVVREPAFSAIAHVDIALLEANAQSWSEADDPSIREMACESLRWGSTNPLAKVLLNDTDRVVRSRAREACVSFSEEATANVHLRFLHEWAETSGDSPWVTGEVYARGEALASIGSISAARELRFLVLGRNWPAGIATWISTLSTRIIERERKSNRRVAAGEQVAIVEKLVGHLLVQNKRVPCSFSLWQSRESLKKIRSWGAIVTSDSSDLFVGMNVDFVVVAVKGRQQSKALVTYASSEGYAVLSGSGPYPEEIRT